MRAVCRRGKGRTSSPRRALTPQPPPRGCTAPVGAGRGGFAAGSPNIVPEFPYHSEPERHPLLTKQGCPERRDSSFLGMTRFRHTDVMLSGCLRREAPLTGPERLAVCSGAGGVVAEPHCQPYGVSQTPTSQKSPAQHCDVLVQAIAWGRQHFPDSQMPSQYWMLAEHIPPELLQPTFRQ
jgi:hypothetical protein